MIFYIVIPNFKSIFLDNISAVPIATKILFDVHTNIHIDELKKILSTNEILISESIEVRDAD